MRCRGVSPTIACGLSLVVLAAGAATVPSARAKGDATPDCSRTSVGSTPLIDLSSGTYRGYAGGLYLGSNTPPAAYLAQGLDAARSVRPLDPAGSPTPSGKIALVSIGMSNAMDEFAVFQANAGTSTEKDAHVVVVNGAQSGQTADLIDSPSASYWANVDQRLSAAGVTAAQVQVAWLKEAIRRPSEPFPEDAVMLKDDLAAIVGILQQHYPNLRIVYASSRTYGGYAVTDLNPEPFAYESGFAVKWLIQDRIPGGVARPWVAWGPYLWTDGTRGRSDGLVWTCSDVEADGTHPSRSGREKVADLLMKFFLSDPTAKPWFTGTAVPPAGGGGPPGSGVQEVRNIPYGSAGGKRLLLDAYLPTGTTDRRPGIVLIHGGGWHAGDKSDFTHDAMRIARLGWPAFSINYRLEPPAKFPAAITDTLNAVRWLRGHAGRYRVDPAKLGVLGDSAGGNLAALLATRGRGPLTVGSRVLAAASWSGPMDLARLARSGGGRAAKTVAHYLGCSPKVCAKRYALASPVTAVDRTDAPILIANSAQEIIPLSQARELASRLQAAHVGYKLVVLPGSRHARRYRDDVWKTTLQFFEKYLGPLPVQDFTPRVRTAR